MGRKQDNGMFLWVGGLAQVVDRERERETLRGMILRGA
jgi:hypothetical protein